MMEKSMLETLLNTDRSDTAERYKSASLIMEECGDPEMAEVLKVLSAQMDFDDSDNSVASEAIKRTREKMDKMIEERKERHANQYIQNLRDEEILEMSGGEVLKSDYSELHSRYLKNGLFDPDIFGGSGKIHKIAGEEKLDISDFGKGIGHIVLPCRVIAEDSYMQVASILGLNPKDVGLVAKYARHIVIESKTDKVEKGKILTEEEYQKLSQKYTGDELQIGIGADALYKMLVNLHYSDQPERLAFKVVPVIAPMYRPMAYIKDEHRFFVDCITIAYSNIINNTRRYNRLIEIGVPDIIKRNEERKVAESVENLFHVIGKRIIAKNKSITNKWYRISFMAHMALAQRKRRFGFVYAKGEKICDIESLNLYPEMINLQKEDGSIEKISLEEIIDSCNDSIMEYTNDHAIILNGEEPTEEEEKESAEVQKHIDRMNDVLDAIWDGAEKKREEFTVKFNFELNLYEAVA